MTIAKTFAEFGFGLNKAQFLGLVEQYVEKFDLSSKFVNGKPGEEWYRSFMNRWSKKFSPRTPELLTLTRALSCNKTVVDAWFKLLHETLLTNDLLEKPGQILNCDETGLSTNSKGSKIICKREIKNPVTIMPGSGKEQYTVLSTISASGKNFPPFILYKGKNLYQEWMVNGPKNALYGVTENGWMETRVFTEYFNHLVKWLKDTPRPTVLIFDGHMSHISLETVQTALDSSIIILCLPAHCSHLLQPLDVGVFKQAKTTWRQILRDHYAESRLKAVNKAVFPKLLKRLYSEAFKPAHIVQSFAKTGIFPFDPTAIATDKLKAAEVFERPKDAEDTNDSAVNRDTNVDILLTSGLQTSSTSGLQTPSTSGLQTPSTSGL